jgi:hypothetical protein
MKEKHFNAFEVNYNCNWFNHVNSVRRHWNTDEWGKDVFCKARISSNEEIREISWNFVCKEDYCKFHLFACSACTLDVHNAQAVQVSLYEIKFVPILP